MGSLLGIAATGLRAVLLHRLRSGVTVGCVVAALVPFVAGLGISRGLRDQAEDSVREGADLTVTGRRLGRDAALPLEAVALVRAVPGVTDVVPRIVGEIRLGADAVSAVLVGLPRDRLPKDTTLVRGHLFAEAPAAELVVGSALALRLGLTVGSRIPPFYRSARGERVFTVVGVFRSDLPVWEANLVFVDLTVAAEIFDQQGLVSSLLVTTGPKDREAVKTAIDRLEALGPVDAHGPVRARVVTRDRLTALLAEGLLRKEGVFDLLWLLALALAIPVVLVTSGVGHVERRREVGILKAVGWQTDEVLVRALAESLLLAIAAAAIAIVLAYLWLEVLGGFGIASVFYSGLDAMPGVRIPFRLAPVPALLSTLMSIVVVTTGSVVSSWRAASASPAEVVR